MVRTKTQLIKDNLIWLETNTYKMISSTYTFASHEFGFIDIKRFGNYWVYDSLLWVKIIA